MVSYLLVLPLVFIAIGIALYTGPRKNKATTSQSLTPSELLFASAPMIFLIAGLAGLSFHFFTKSVDLLYTTFFAGLIVVPWTSRNNFVEHRAHFSAALLTLLSAGLFAPALLHPFFKSGFSVQFSLLVVGTIGLFGLISSVFTSAAAISHRSQIPLVAFGVTSLLSALMLGIMRSNQAGLHYSIPLGTGLSSAHAHTAVVQQPLYWVLDPIPQRPDGLRFFAVVDAPLLLWLMIAAVVLGLLYIAAIALLPSTTTPKGLDLKKESFGKSKGYVGIKDNKIARYLLLLSLVTTIAVVIALDVVAPNLHLPPSESFIDLAKNVGKIPQEIGTSVSGHFKTSTNLDYHSSMGLAILQSSFVFDRFFIYLGLLSFAFSAWVSFRPRFKTTPNTDLSTIKIADAMMLNTVSTIMGRGTVAAGLLMAGAGLYQMRYLGVSWIGTPSEWIGVALFFLMSGATFAIVHVRHKVVRAGEDFSKMDERVLITLQVLAAHAVILSVVWGLSYHTVVGFSASLF